MFVSPLYKPGKPNKRTQTETCFKIHTNMVKKIAFIYTNIRNTHLSRSDHFGKIDGRNLQQRVLHGRQLPSRDPDGG